ncbi:eCIS core domain-containing protein [Streptomyces qinglanensis]|uniref:eCIS core domain-containing protein n=1 Tax=Streptomyces qinglanensis TaxID=943816 RepID=A0A1H9WE87_9ACTN|nr:protein of unknown function [Streptomyces qinglanensis]
MHAHERLPDSEQQGQVTAGRQVTRTPGQVARAPSAPLPPSATTALQRTVGNAAVARMVEKKRQERGGGAPVQRSSVPQVLRSAGRPLDGEVRSEMEARLGADFSDVRVHTGTSARASAEEIGARAYTSGNHVVIGAGGEDRHTLAHELTHVIQQRSGSVAGTDRGDGLKVSDPSDRFERAAEANATRALAEPLVEAPDPATRAGESAHPGDAVQRAPSASSSKRKKDEAGIKGNSPPPRRATRASARGPVDLDHPRLEFRSWYEGPATQRLNADQSIGFGQAATLHNPANAPQRVSTNYHFWQQVTDRSVQIVAADGLHDQSVQRPWGQDARYRPPYTSEVINDEPAQITFNDNPGFSTDQRLTAGYFVKSYSISFRWKVARAEGTWNTNNPAWTSPVVTHTFTSAFDPDEPEAASAVVHQAAGDHTWNVDLTNVGNDNDTDTDGGNG